MSRLVRRGLWIVVATYLALCVIGGVLLAEISLRLQKMKPRDSSVYRLDIQRKFQAAVEDVSIATADGANLQAWFVQPPHGNGKSVLMLHGITASRADSTGFAEPFLQRGYAVLMPDSREHGESGGAIATYGILERYDVKQWVQWIRTRDPGCTYLLGESMGAAIGLQATAVTPDLCAVAVEAPYATFREISYERLGRGSHTGTEFWRTLARPILEVAIVYTKLRYGIYLPDANPEAAVKAASTPTLLIAGTLDNNIPMQHAQELERVCASHCSLWVVPGADHCGASTVAHAEFFRRILDWFETHDRH